MKLREAVLCIDCEHLYSHANRCPACGSQVSYPLDRALNRPAAIGDPLRGVVPVHEAQQRSRALVGMGTWGNPLLQTA